MTRGMLAADAKGVGTWRVDTYTHFIAAKTTYR